MSGKKQLTAAIDDIWAILRSLPGQRDAAMVIAGVWAKLIEQGPNSETVVREKIRDVNEVVLHLWSKHTGVSLRQ